MSELARKSDIRPGIGIFGDEFDNLFEGFFRPLSRVSTSDNGVLMPTVNVVDEETQYVVAAELPGVDRKDIDVAVNDGVLTINAERKRESEEKNEKGKVIRQETQYGTYSRRMRLDSTIDEQNIKANYKDGVLKLVLPKVEKAVPKKVEIDIN